MKQLFFVFLLYQTGTRIGIEEVHFAIKAMKEGKASGPDNTQAEFLKLLDDESVMWPTLIINRISGNIPQEWLQSEFIILP